MDPFSPDMSASDDSRRKAALAALTVLIKEGVESDPHHLETSIITGDEGEDRFDSMIEHLSAYSTETLEYTAVLRSSPGAPRPYLHRIFRTMEDWRETTGEHSDMMFRDVVSLRRITIPLGHWEKFPLFEMYKATGIQIGRLHEVGFNRERDVAEALILAARVSRMAEQKGLRDVIKGIRTNQPYSDSIQTLRFKLKASYERNQLTDEWVSYFTNKPENRSAVCDYLLEQKLPLRESSPQLVDEYIAAHSALKSGVL